MLKKHLAACLFATAFAAAPALAQTSTPPPSGSTDRPAATGSGSATTGSPAMQPGSQSPTMGSSTTSSSSMSGPQGNFVTQLPPGAMMTSKLIGTTVVSTTNESIGDVNDVIVDRNGQAMAVVVGVGGFLGIGEKDVAVPFQSLEFAPNARVGQQPSTPGGATSTSDATTTTGSTSQQPSPATSASNGSGGVPDRIVLRMSKAELQAAPEFRTRSGDDDRANTTGTTGGSPTAPRQ
jgi:PRC-barrel domain